jgi:hypothetical protein
MEAQRVRRILLVSLILGTLLLAVFPVDPQMSTEVMFDDEVTLQRKADIVGGESGSSLVLRVTHDDSTSLMFPVSRVQELLNLEHEAMAGTNPDTSWHTNKTTLDRIQSPFSLWDEAFDFRNRSLENATGWNDVLQPLIVRAGAVKTPLPLNRLPLKPSFFCYQNRQISALLAPRCRGNTLTNRQPRMRYFGWFGSARINPTRTGLNSKYGQIS